MPDIMEGNGKIETNLKNVQFLRALMGNFCHLSFNGKNAPPPSPPFHHSDTKYPL